MVIVSSKMTHMCNVKYLHFKFLTCTYSNGNFKNYYFLFAVSFPLDLVRRRKQLEGIAGRVPVYKTGLLGTFKLIVHNEGVRGLYRGILPEYCKVIPSVSIVFMTYEFIKAFLAENSVDGR